MNEADRWLECIAKVTEAVVNCLGMQYRLTIASRVVNFTLTETYQGAKPAYQEVPK